MKTLKAVWFLIFLSLLNSPILFAQREADNWIMGIWAGLNFSTGDPVPWLPVEGDAGFDSGTVMSDSLGNLLFYSDGSKVWNKNGEIMMNGLNLLPDPDDGSWTQAATTFPMPGDANKYYLFTISDWIAPRGFYYSVIDMTLDGGLGAVTEEKNIELPAAFWAHDHQFVTKNKSGDSYWVITRLYNDDRFASFLVDESGVHQQPVYSSTGVYRDFLYGDGGCIKISPDKKFLSTAHFGQGLEISEWYLRSFEICTFNAETGEIGYLYMINSFYLLNHFREANSCEFSPDSKYFYAVFDNGPDSNYLYQYDMQYIEDSSAFLNSAILISQDCGVNLRLSNDGRIYSSANDSEYYENYMGIINDPWEHGTDCNFVPHSIYLLGRRPLWYTPEILLDYLYRFEWEADNYCQGTPVHFIPHFIPEPDSIEWNFDEFAPGSISNELSPTYSFQLPGTHDVKVDIWYPTGRFEHTSREIEIYPTPQPDLGPDITICEGASVILNANCIADMYSWSTSQFGNPEITVTDSGTYWVRASFFETGCIGSDTIHVGYYPPILIDETSLVVMPTSCGGATGSIAGLTIQGTDPLQYLWEDLSGNDYGTGIDVFNLPAGQYVLTITDVNGCETESPVYTIEDAGNLQVMLVQTTRPHCFRNDGQIIISAFSPSGSLLEYSIDNGNSYSTDSIFTGLIAGNYIVRIRDINGCEGFYVDNPVILADIPGPQVQSPVVTDETDFLGNGSIEISATGSTPQIFFSIDNGNSWQVNDGNFYNLQSGIYNLQIKDENGCDTAFTVEIQNVILTYLHAVTGEEGICETSTALIPVNVDNFNSVASFHLKLSYNADNLQCEGFTNVQPQLLDSLTGWVDQAAGIINLAWNSPSPLTFTQPETVAELVFTTKNPGQGELAWYTGTTESYFTNSSGNPIPAQFSTGEVTIYNPPSIILSAAKTVCEGQSVSFMSIASGNQPPFTFQWTYPDGTITANDPFLFNVNQSMAGYYFLQATDQVGCTDQKSIELIVSENPVAVFHGTDTLEMQAGDVLDAGTGLSSYHWNTGDSTASIVINSEGMYTVEMESPVGCLGSDSVYVKLTTEEIPEFEVYVPNAFSPNNDGINDIFQIKFPHSTFNIQHSTLSIFNRWGEEIFQSDDITQGWDGKKNGKECPGGVYVYKIVFSVDGIPGNQERVGTVMLVR
jgi:gliding motility-associated-like protein